LRFIARVAPLVCSALLSVALCPAFLFATQLPFHPSATAANAENPVAVVKSLRIYHDKEGIVVEVNLTHKVEPVITKLDGPPRLVVDLPNTLMLLSRKRYAFSGGQISDVRIDQYRNAPPMARAVIDLLSSADFSWDSTKNRLKIHVHAEPNSQPETVFKTGEQAAVMPETSASSGSLLLAGSRIGNGSSITAGADTAILRLARGGEVRVCPGSTVSVTSSKNGRELMLGMSTGALEVHCTLTASTDSVLTPDFQLRLVGPGEFDYAMSVDNRGDTCVRALPGNTAPVAVSELMGNGIYQVRPDEQVVFHGGWLATHDAAVPLNCGCPPEGTTVLRASTKTSPSVSSVKQQAVTLSENRNPRKQSVPATSSPDSRNPDSLPAQVEVSTAHPESAPLPKSKPEDVHIQVDAPFVFRAPEAHASAPAVEMTQLPILQNDPEPMPVAILPPPAAAKKSHGFFSKVKHFFGSIFH
jgi:AMIN domain